jgi:hypothetical protein
MKVVNIDLAYRKGILAQGEIQAEDSALFLNAILDAIRTRYNVEILIQSGVSLDRGKPVQWQCMIGRQLDDYAHSQLFSSGLGDNFADCIASSLNEFFEYFGIHKPYLIDNGK